MAQTYNSKGSLTAHPPSYEIDLNAAAPYAGGGEFGDRLENDMPRDIAAMKMASLAYRANLKTLQTANRMFDVALDVMA